MKDPIMEELHRLREEYAKKFDYNSDKIYQDLRMKEQKLKSQGWKIVSY